MPTSPGPAPDFDERPYPSAGVKIGPAWQAAWEALHVTDRDGWELVEVMRAAAPGLTERGALDLLDEACRAGWVYRQRTVPRIRSAYRLTYAARRLRGAQTASQALAHVGGRKTAQNHARRSESGL